MSESIKANIRRQKIRTAIVGVGVMGTSHARHILEGRVPGLELAAVCDPNPAALSRFDGVPQFTDYEQMLADASLDAVIIATPHFDHIPMGIRALSRGLHVLVEKPLAVHKEACAEFLKAASCTNLVASVMLSMRARPLFQKIRSMIQGGELGTLRRVDWIATDWFRTENYYQLSSWRGTWKGEGGGLLLNQCPHQLDLWWWMFGQPDQITAFCTEGRYHDIETEDDITAVLSYEDGLKGVFVSSTGESPGTNRLEIAGENGRLIAEGNQLVFSRNEEPMSVFSKRSNLPMNRPAFANEEIPIEPPAKSGHETIMQNFADAILHGKPLLSPASEAIHAVEIANAMHLSSWLQTSVALPIDAALFRRHLNKRITQSESSLVAVL